MKRTKTKSLKLSRTTLRNVENVTGGYLILTIFRSCEGTCDASGKSACGTCAPICVTE